MPKLAGGSPVFTIGEKILRRVDERNGLYYHAGNLVQPGVFSQVYWVDFERDRGGLEDECDEKIPPSMVLNAALNRIDVNCRDFNLADGFIALYCKRTLDAAPVFETDDWMQDPSIGYRVAIQFCEFKRTDKQ